jgi:DNA-binding CsgD family transcriptional regulator
LETTPPTPPEEMKLSAREIEIVDLAAAGALDKQIADRLGCSFHTVREHWRRIRAKTATTNRGSAMVAGILLSIGIKSSDYNAMRARAKITP